MIPVEIGPPTCCVGGCDADASRELERPDGSVAPYCFDCADYLLSVEDGPQWTVPATEE